LKVFGAYFGKQLGILLCHSQIAIGIGNVAGKYAGNVLLLCFCFLDELLSVYRKEYKDE